MHKNTYSFLNTTVAVVLLTPLSPRSVKGTLETNDVVVWIFIFILLPTFQIDLFEKKKNYQD